MKNAYPSWTASKTKGPRVTTNHKRHKIKCSYYSIIWGFYFRQKGCTIIYLTPFLGAQAPQGDPWKNYHKQKVLRIYFRESLFFAKIVKDPWFFWDPRPIRVASDRRVAQDKKFLEFDCRSLGGIFYVKMPNPPPKSLGLRSVQTTILWALPKNQNLCSLFY